METRRYDTVIKALGRGGADRRRVLRVLAAGLTAALGGQRATVADECKKAGQQVKDKKECCSGLMEADSRCCQEVLEEFRFCGSGLEGCCNPSAGLVCCTPPGADPHCRTQADCDDLSPSP